jgi:hypothetical protein
MLNIKIHPEDLRVKTGWIKEGRLMDKFKLIGA